MENMRKTKLLPRKRRMKEKKGKHSYMCAVCGSTDKNAWKHYHSIFERLSNEPNL